MKLLKFKGEYYRACAPQYIGNGKYICDAQKIRTGRVVRDASVLNGLALLLIRKRKKQDDQIEKGWQNK
ncbi:MAG: hypothetical protein WA125_17630 [Desulfosporosinus sp.]